MYVQAVVSLGTWLCLSYVIFRGTWSINFVKFVNDLHLVYMCNIPMIFFLFYNDMRGGSFTSYFSEFISLVLVEYLTALHS